MGSALSRFPSVIGFLFFFGFILLLFGFWGEGDLAVSRFFADANGVFYFRDGVFLLALEKTAFWGARAIALLLIVGALVSSMRKRTFLFLPGRGWLFLLLALLIGPGLLANVGFKDHWGRARPREIVQFGGTKPFTPAFVPADQCARNCSFVSGDASFGFILPCLAYVVPRRRSRRVFWAAMGAGALFGGARLLLGAHFLSDVLFAAALSLATGAGLAAIFFGGQEVLERWRLWFSSSSAASRSLRP